MSIWERKALNFINQTGRWDKDKHISSFLAFSIALVKSLMEADIALQLEFEDEETAKVKCASPLHLNGLVLNPAPIKKLLYTEDFKTIYWREIPPAKENVFKEILPALSSAIIIPVDTSPNNSLLVLGWSEPPSFEPGFLECIETIRLRLKEILVQSQQQIYFQRVAIRFAAILHTIPHALVFINNDGVSGWVNQEGANLLGLSGPGEQLPAVLSDAMTQLRNKALNITTIERAAVPLFSSPENSISNWNWQLENKLLLVSCLPVTTQQICGRLWIFENGDQ
ncbi:hypothetical protein [Chitinophaga ginsengisegetis]|uniref:hypothetical protein n=1 Tax=Chitinophaga ginsengisegetis TaxID=393003 RepID=UPI000DB928AA|nr:hypothetical protein [Chitinophaga ginsengisegetis]MDR6568384.1 hypothetical protein [Chitinophaga ginsengisegetis]MDR6648385.1 hypothetical protein [Chitinophaga ginsengisegetis]MDR6654465.1 hypothetical protein [Chitinophaga ginsengisegetis]